MKYLQEKAVTHHVEMCYTVEVKFLSEVFKRLVELVQVFSVILVNQVSWIQPVNEDYAHIEEDVSQASFLSEEP